MTEQPKIKNENLEKILGDLRRQFEDFRVYGEECSECRSDKTFAYDIQDKAFSIHYIDDVANYICSGCGRKWSGQYGYRGLA